ncbi:SixA phosphatase family protein [Aliarcobacter thereius]|uniref:Phosphohistidine phosphatase n=1 Tax=Aliarcobacter thereius LMG 24486 TaxID=1032240 RepID=A0A1C7WVG4_9BACT|nr:histidine phosphatase family protein [Aliarcobacter thereius]OCL89782.1 phosphohistidine phosphatase [Aliarcobacter thereius]OCL96432.1 phosphohistidine phosphatase [Aliarcobacter thereius LMG 24486]QBF15606.1 phosphohistidine phosphatase [Aliarcobacter thereius LMG 24486]TLS91702.1 phosphoglycerate mutase [Aliarcobacter thereius]TLT06172.1 phosphoglycerate mutase [Aliarcobacter thereius]
MKKLFITVHSSSKEENPQDYDYDTDLSQKGLEDTLKMAKHFSSLNQNIDLIVASPAIRTRKTADIFAENLNYKKTIMLNEVLYMAFVNELIETITYTYDSVDNLLVIGHNPSLTALAVTLLGFKERVENGAILQINFDCDSWIDIDKSNAKLVKYIKIGDI